MSARQGLIQRLADRLGESHVLVSDSDLANYLVGSRGAYRGTALAVVRPRDTAEVAFVVRECAAADMPLVPAAGLTGVVGGAVPDGGIVLSLGRLNRVRAIDTVNASITVEAGCTLLAVREAAASADSLFPLSLPSEGSCMIGGNLSTNAGGTAVLRYGNARELVLGLEVVLADGQIWNGLSGLRKDNTGYDLKNLFIGAEGTLGIITAAVLKLYPAPRVKATGFVGCASARDALALFETLRRAAGDCLTAFEYLPSFAVEAVLRHLDGTVRPLAEHHASYALIELTSARADEPLRERLETAFADALESGLIADATIGASEAQNAGLWALRERMWEVQPFIGAAIKYDVSVPISHILDLIDQATAACNAVLPDLRICAFGHFGDGNIHFHINQPLGMDAAAFLTRTPEFNRLVYDITTALGGSISAEHGIGQGKRAELAHYKDPVALHLMRQIKRTLDPRGILNPGKVLPD